MALKEELTLDTRQAEAQIRKMGAQLGQLSKQFGKDFNKAIKAPTVEKIKAPKIDKPVVPAPDTTVARHELNKLARGFQTDFRTAGTEVAKTVGAIGAAAAAAGAASVNVFADFELSLSRIEGLVGLSAKTVKGFKGDILALSGETTKSPKELAEALYFITSSGIPASAAMDVLKQSAKAAAAGLGETANVADVVTSAMNAYGHDVLSAAKATDIITASVREGKGEATDFAQSIGRVLPIAANLGVTFQQVGAATAALTLNGLDAAEATTALRQVLATILSPTKEAKEALAGMGLSADGLRKQISEKGLLPTLKTFAEAAEGDAEATDAFFGNIRALTGFLSITGANLSKTEQIFKKLENTTGDTNKAFAAFRKTTQATFDVVKATGKQLGIAIGGQLAPAVKAFAKVAIIDMAKLTETFRGLSLGLNEKELTKKFERMRKAAEGLEPAIAGLGIALTAKLGGGLPIIGQFLGLINPWVALLGGVVLSSEQSRDALFNLGEPIQELVRSISTLATEVLPPLIDSFNALAGPVISVLGSGIRIFASVLQVIANNSNLAAPAIGALVGSLIALKVVGSVNRAMTVITGNIWNLQVAAARAGGGVSGFAKALTGLGPVGIGVGLAVGLLTAAFISSRRESQETEKRVKEITDALKEQDATLRSVAKSTVEKRLEDKNQAKDLDRLGVSQGDFTKAVLGNAKAQEELRASMIKTGELNLVVGSTAGASSEQIKANEIATAKLREEYIKYGTTTQSVASGQQVFISGNKGLKTSLEDLTAEFNESAKNRLVYLRTTEQITEAEKDEAIVRNTDAKTGAVNYAAALRGLENSLANIKTKAGLAKDAAASFKTSMDAIFGRQLDVTEATVAWEAALDDLTETLKRNNGELRVSEPAGRESFERTKNATTAAFGLAQSLVAEGKSSKKAAEGVRDHVAELRKVLIAANKSEEEVDKFLTTLGLAPNQVDVKVQVLIEQEQLRKFLKETTSLNDEEIALTLTYATDPKALKKVLAEKGLASEDIKTAIKLIDTEALDKLNAFGKKKKEKTKDEKVNIEVGIGNALTALENLKKAFLPAFENLRTAASNIFSGLNAPSVLGPGGLDGNPKTPWPRALGGSVQAGQPYTVGERGRELFVPQMNGTIIPNSVLNKTSNRNTTLNVYARTADIDETNLRDILRRESLLSGAA